MSHKIESRTLDDSLLEVEKRIEALTKRFQQEWQGQTRPRIEDFLHEVPVDHQLALFRELLILELNYRLANQEPIDAGEYLERFPHRDIVEELLLAFPIGTMCEQPREKVSPSPTDKAVTFSKTPEAPCNLDETLSSSELPPPEDFPLDQAKAFAPTEDIEASSAPQTVKTTNTVPPPLPEIPGYKLEDKLGEGGMGVVYQARQLALNRLVALKMVLGHAGKESLARFYAEAEAIAQLQHPNMVQIYEIGEYRGSPWFSLELVQGGNLSEWLAGQPQLPHISAALTIVLANAMQVAHDKGIIHRDLKPANVLVEKVDDFSTAHSTQRVTLNGITGSPSSIPVLKITDFGLVKNLDDESAQTQTGQIMGTPSYMAPEQAEGDIQKIGSWSDTYALGAILYEMLTGRPPFKGASPWDTISQVVTQEPVLPSSLQPGTPRDLETICMKCLEKEPQKRYSSALELSEDLQRYLSNQPILARPAGRIERVCKWVRRSPAQATALIAGLVCLLALVIALYGQMQSAQSRASLRGEKITRLQREKELSERQQTERQRLDRIRADSTALILDAERKAREAPNGEVQSWRVIQQRILDALKQVDREPSLADFPLRELAQRLLHRAERELADAEVKAEQRSRLTQLQRIRSDAVFYSALATGLDLQENLNLAKLAIEQGLKLFNVKTSEKKSLAIDPRYFSSSERRLILACCYELLLMDAGILARPILGEKVRDWHQRIRQALNRLDRADQLQPGMRTYSGLLRRSRYLSLLGEDESARKVRNLSEETAPSLAFDYFLIGMERHRLGNAQEAVKPLATALRLQPGHYGAEHLLATCRLQLREWQAAKEGFSRCLRQRPDFIWPRLSRGYAEMELGNFDAALADFNAVLAQPPATSASYVARVNRSVLRMRRKQWSEAINDLKSAIKLKPDAIPAYINLALTHRQSVEIPDWRRHTIQMAPHGGFSALLLSDHKRMGLNAAVQALDQGIEMLTGKRNERELLRHAGALSRLHRERGQLHLQLGRLKSAREDFVRAVALAPGKGSFSTLADDLLELGKLQYKQCKHREAIQMYQAVLRVRSDKTLAWRLMAEPLLALKRYQEAGESLDRYLETIPVASTGKAPTPEVATKLARTLKARGLVHANQGDYRAALESYARGLKLNRDPETLALRGWSYLILQSPYLARLDFDEAIQKQPTLGNAWLGRANAQIKLGRLSEALKDVKEGLQFSPKSRRTFYNAARVYAQAVSQARQTARPSRVVVSRCERRAVELLASALARLSAGEQKAFWQKYVIADRAFLSIRSGEAMQVLSSRIGAPDSR